MKKKTKIIIIICIVLVVALFLFFKFVNKYALQNFWFNIQMIGVDKDIIIEKRGGPVQMGVYARSSYDYYIDLDKKKIYEVSDYYVYGDTIEEGEIGSHYTIKRKKDLSNDEISVILKLTEVEPNSNSSSSSQSSSPLSSFFDIPVYYNIKYNNKVTSVSDETATPLKNIINSMK